MAKELFISTTPHETKVAVVEDEQLNEIYFERENEYTLAGSIYKGRVTRVLPGMQSAFVDVGLERDAFLYVTDFLEEQEDQEEFEQVVNRAHSDAHQQPHTEQQPAAIAESAESARTDQSGSDDGSREDSQAPAQDFDRGPRRWRGRREPGHSEPEETPQPERFNRDRSRSRWERPNRRPEREPAGREEVPSGPPVVALPGETLAKYRDRGSSSSDGGAVLGSDQPATSRMSDSYVNAQSHSTAAEVNQHADAALPVIHSQAEEISGNVQYSKPEHAGAE